MCLINAARLAKEKMFLIYAELNKHKIFDSITFKYNFNNCSLKWQQRLKCIINTTREQKVTELVFRRPASPNHNFPVSNCNKTVSFDLVAKTDLICGVP